MSDDTGFSSRAIREFHNALTASSIFGVPRYTTANLPSVTSNQGGLAWDTTTNTLKGCNGTVWANAGSTGDVVGPGVVSASTIPIFADTTGTLLASTSLTGSASTLSALGGLIPRVNSLTPAAITTTQAGINVGITASPARPGTSVAGAAAGGSIVLTAGAADRLTSGNADGGGIQLVPGAGIGTGVVGNVTILNDSGLNLGTTNDSTRPLLQWNTTQTVDTGMLLTGSTSNHWVIAERADNGFDFAHAAATDPTLFIHSHNQNTAQYLGLRHDGTDAVYIAGTGAHSFSGSLKTDGNYNVSGAITGYNLGTGAEGGSYRYGTSQTPDAGMLLTGSLSNSIIIAEFADISFDFAHAQATNPTLFIHSAAQNTTQWVGLAHNATHPVITSGLGPVALVGGANVASATALPLPTGNVFHVTGTTTVTSITSTGFTAGMMITLIFDAVLTFTDGSNLKLAGNFVTSADDTITLVYDGTNWYETARSIN